MKTLHILSLLLLTVFIFPACNPSPQGTHTDAVSPETHSDSSVSSDAIRISYAMQEGASWVTKSSEKTVMTANPGTKFESVTKLEVGMKRKFNLEKIDKENALNIKVSYLEVQVKYKDDRENWTYNSSDEHGRTEALGFESLVGNTLEIRVNPATGQLLNVRGAETIYAILGRDDLKPFAERIFMGRFNQELYIYADGPVEVGQEWTREFNVAAPYGLHYQHQFQLEKRNNGQGFLKRTSKVSMGEMPTSLYTDGRKFDLKGTASANINVDEATGQIYALVSNMELEGRQTLPGRNPGDPLVNTPIHLKVDLISEMSMK